MGDWLDLILVAVFAVFAAFGYRQGLVAGVLSLAGFACGAAAGARAAPGLASALLPAGPTRDFLAIVIGFAAAVTGMLVASVLASMLRQVSRRPVGRADSVGGAALNVMFLAVVALVVASLVVGGPSGLLSRQVDRSLVLRAVDDVVPKYMINSVRVSMLGGLDNASGLDPADLPPPSPAVLKSRAAALAPRGVVKVEVVTRSCSSSSLQSTGSGLVIGPHHVLTNAHVVAGLTRPPVVALATGQQTYQARVVLYDQRRDIAVLYVPGLRAAVLHFTRSASFAASALVAGFPAGGGLTLTPATVGRSVNATVAGTGWKRQAYRVRGQIEPGNSGGPLMAPDGGIYGVVFARSSGAPPSGWALTAAEVAHDAADGIRLTKSIRVPAPQSCQRSSKA